MKRYGITRRSFLGLATSSVAASVIGCNSGTQSSISSPVLPEHWLRLETSTTSAAVPVLSWDTEGGSRLLTNLLREPIVLRVRIAGTWYTSADLNFAREILGSGTTRFRIKLGGDAELI